MEITALISRCFEAFGMALVVMIGLSTLIIGVYVACGVLFDALTVFRENIERQRGFAMARAAARERERRWYLDY